MPTILETSKVPGLRRLYRLSMLTAAVAGMFCAVFAGILFYNYHAAAQVAALTQDDADMSSQPLVLSSDPSYRRPASDVFNVLPTDQRRFRDLKNRLAADKQNETLQAEIRQLDREFRLDFFRRRAILARTAPMLLVAAVVGLIALRTAGVLKRRIPVPSGDAKVRARREEQRRLQLGTLTIVALAALVVGMAVGLLILPTSPLEAMIAAKLGQEPEADRSSGDSDGVPPASPALGADTPPPDRETQLAELAAQWPAFRGFDGSGSGRSELCPVRWNATTGENLRWKTPIPLPGKSSPVVWVDGDKPDGKLFLTGAVADKRQVFCFDTETGRLLWTADAPSTPESVATLNVSEDTGYAAPTMVLDGRRAFALFANGDLVALDFDGKVLWSKSLGIPESAYGFSSSPALYFDRLIVQYDVGDGTDGKSKLYAFDVRTGKVVWETPREIGNSWASPMVRKIGDRWQIVTCGDPFVIAYDPENGQELWRCKCLAGDVGPSPTAWGTTVLTTNQGPRTTAIDATGSGDVTETHVLWRGTNALPDTASPFATETRFYTFDSHGYLTGYDPTNINERNKRAMFWELEVGGGEAGFYASPLRVGNLVYLFSKSEEGAEAFVVDLSKAQTAESGELTPEAAQAMLVAANPMPEPCVASPAVVNGRLYIRGNDAVYCIEKKP